MHGRFVLIFCAVALTGLGGVAWMNYAIDPEGVFMPGGAYTRAALFNIERISRRKAVPILVSQVKPNVAAFGNSRVQYSWNPEHERFSGQRAVNAAVSGATIHEIYGYLRHAHFAGPGLQTAYVGLDLAVFEPGVLAREGFEAGGLRTTPQTEGDKSRGALHVERLLNFDTTAMSFSFLNRWRKGVVPASLGFASKMQGSDRDPRLLRFLIEEVHYRKVYAKLESNGLTEAQLSSYRKLVVFARQQDIELVTYFNPIHARLRLVMQHSGALQHLHALQAFVVDTHRQAAKVDESWRNAVWDFSAVSSITSESVPLSAANNDMRFFWDASHHKTGVGDLMISTMASGSAEPPDFGTRLGQVDLQAYVRDGDMALQEFLAVHPQYRPHLDFVLDHPDLTIAQVECHPSVRQWLQSGGYANDCRD